MTTSTAARSLPSPNSSIVNRDDVTRGAELIEFAQELPGTPEDVFEFFANALNLESITPAWLRFRVVTPPPIAMSEGTLIDYRLNWRVVPIRWRTLISAWEPPHRFVDEQLRGPYQVWHHEHLFERRRDRTVMRDRVHFRAPLAMLSHPLIVRRDIDRIFAFRRDAITRAFAPRPVECRTSGGHGEPVG